MRDLLTDKNQRGIGVLEVIISLMVVTASITTVMLVIFNNQSIKLDDEVNNVALYRASQMIEKSKVLGESNFSSVVASSSTDGIFNEDLVVMDISPCRKDVKSSISWSVQINRPQNVFLITSLVSAEEAAALGGDCELTPPSENWEIDCPPQYGYDFNPGGLSATALDLIKRGSNKYVVITSNKGSVEKEDFWIVDVTDKLSINKVSSINISTGLNDVDAFENYAFVANDTTTDQLVVINIADLSNPATVAFASLPGVDPAGSFPQGREVFYYDDRLYVGTHRTAGPEFHVYDVSNPANPTHLGSLELNHNINQILVRGNYAYLATSDDSGELMIIDISNPAAMVHPDVTGFKFTASGTQDGISLYLLGNKMYLGRERGTGVNYDFYVLDVATPNLISSLGYANLNLNPNTAAQGMIVSNNLAFIVTTDQNRGFQLWSVSDPGNITEIDSCNYSEKVVDIDFDGEHHYVANESNNALRIISSVNP